MEVAVFGIAGAVFLALDFPATPVVLGFVLGPLLEENFRRALLLSRGDVSVYLTRPISSWFMAACALVVAAHFYAYLRHLRKAKPAPLAAVEIVGK
jgi:TctA family transporter